MKLTKNFTLEELVHKDIIAKVGDRSADFLHIALAPTLQAMRDKFGSIVVNGMYKGKEFTRSGLRRPHGRIGAMLSAHKFGCAADCKFTDITPIEVQKYIMDHQDEFPYITRLENALITETWLHVETGSKRKKGQSINVFNP